MSTHAPSPASSSRTERGARILVLQNLFPPHHYGGYELSCRDVVTRWKEAGHAVTVLTSDLRRPGVGDPPDERAAGVRRDLPIAFAGGDLADPPLRQRLGRERRAHAALDAALAEVRPDVVSVWHPAALSTGLLAALARRDLPLVYVVCDDWPTYAHKIDPWMRLFAGRPRLARFVEGRTGVPTSLPDLGATGTFCFISQTTRRRCEAHAPWTFPDAAVTYNGIDHREFPVAIEVPDRPWRWRLVNAGRLDERKGLATAVRALVDLPSEATLTLLPPAGDPGIAPLRRVADASGVGDRLRVIESTRDELRAHYLDADVCVFPTEWEEPFGLVPLEAMACATPVVATGSGGSGEYLHDGGNCLRVTPGDAAGLAAAVRRLAEDVDLRRRLVGAGLRTASELGVDRYAKVLEDWHLAAADRFAAGRPPEPALP